MVSHRPLVVVILSSMVLGALGCASAGAKIREKYPVGYKRLVSVVPECAEPGADLVAHCEVAAEILQSQPRKAVELLLAHVTKTGEAFASASSGERKTIVRRVEKTVVPALRRTLENVNDTYSKAILAAFDTIELGSEKALEALRTGLNAAQKAAAFLR